MTRKNYKNHRIEIIDPVQARLETLIDDMHKMLDDPGFQKISGLQTGTEKEYFDQFTDNKIQLVKDADGIGKKLKEHAHEEAISGRW